jgi:MFS family permease
MARWIAAAGAFVASLDSMVNIAFPAMAATFAVAPEQMRWVIVCYVGTYALTSFVAGALADVLGHGRVFRAGLVLSALGFIVVGGSPTFGWVLAGRVTQGLGGGMIYGTAPGIVTLTAAAATRGRALGLFNAAVAVAFAVGPLVAGIMIETIGWRWVFHARLPLAVLVFAWARVGLPRGPLAGIPRLVRSRELLRLELVHAGALSFVANAGIFAVWLLAPFYLILRRGLDAVAAGTVFMLTPLGTALAAPLAGGWADRLGPRLPMMVGLALEVLGLVVMSRVEPATPLAVIAGALLAAGFGLGVFQVPNMAWIMAAFSAGQQGAAGGVAFLTRTLGVVTGVLVVSTVFAVRRAQVGFDAAFADAFLAAALMVGAATLAALRAPERPLRAP